MTLREEEEGLIHCVELLKQKGFKHGDACYVCFKAKEILK